MSAEIPEQKPEEQLNQILTTDLPMLVDAQEALRVVLVTNYNLLRSNDPQRVFKVLSVLNQWGTGTIREACETTAEAIEKAAQSLGEAFYEETAETLVTQGEFSAETVNARFNLELDEQTRHSQRAQEILRLVSNAALALNIQDPTQAPPAPTVHPTKPNVVVRLTSSLRHLKLPAIFEPVKETEASEGQLPGWTTPPVWSEADLKKFESLEAVGMVVLSDEVQDKWGALQSIRSTITREEIVELLKHVADIAAKQSVQSKAIVEYAEQSRGEFLQMLTRLLWVRKTSDSVLSSLPSAA